MIKSFKNKLNKIKKEKKKKETEKYGVYEKQKKWKLSVQIGYDKKTKIPIFSELTYDYFVSHLGDEWHFTYNNIPIDIACHGQGDSIIYELNINGYNEEKAIRYEFNSSTDLLSAKIEGKTLKELWDNLEN